MCSLALADALADAPSLWTLGNAGMGALQVQLTFIDHVQDHPYGAISSAVNYEPGGSSTDKEVPV